MIYWILSDMAGAHALTHDGEFEALAKSEPASDDVQRFHRLRDAVAASAKLKKKGCHVKPLKQEFVAFYWRLPGKGNDDNDLVEIIEFRSKRQAAAWTKRAIAEGCEVIECKGTARPAKRKKPKR